MLCSKCGYTNQEDAKYCSICGSKMHQTPQPPIDPPIGDKQCKYCGQLNESIASYCRFCGKKIKTTKRRTLIEKEESEKKPRAPRRARSKSKDAVMASVMTMVGTVDQDEMRELLSSSSSTEISISSNTLPTISDLESELLTMDDPVQEGQDHVNEQGLQIETVTSEIMPEESDQASSGHPEALETVLPTAETPIPEIDTDQDAEPVLADVQEQPIIEQFEQSSETVASEIMPEEADQTAIEQPDALETALPTVESPIPEIGTDQDAEPVHADVQEQPIIEQFEQPIETVESAIMPEDTDQASIDQPEALETVLPTVETPMPEIDTDQDAEPVLTDVQEQPIEQFEQPSETVVSEIMPDEESDQASIGQPEALEAVLPTAESPIPEIDTDQDAEPVLADVQEQPIIEQFEQPSETVESAIMPDEESDQASIGQPEALEAVLPTVESPIPEIDADQDAEPVLADVQEQPIIEQFEHPSETVASEIMPEEADQASIGQPEALETVLPTAESPIPEIDTDQDAEPVLTDVQEQPIIEQFEQPSETVESAIMPEDADQTAIGQPEALETVLPTVGSPIPEIGTDQDAEPVLADVQEQPIIEQFEQPSETVVSENMPDEESDQASIGQPEALETVMQMPDIQVEAVLEPVHELPLEGGSLASENDEIVDAVAEEVHDGDGAYTSENPFTEPLIEAVMTVSQGETVITADAVEPQLDLTVETEQESSTDDADNVLELTSVAEGSSSDAADVLLENILPISGAEQELTMTEVEVSFRPHSQSPIKGNLNRPTFSSEPIPESESVATPSLMLSDVEVMLNPNMPTHDMSDDLLTPEEHEFFKQDAAQTASQDGLEPTLDDIIPSTATANDLVAQIEKAAEGGVLDQQVLEPAAEETVQIEAVAEQEAVSEVETTVDADAETESEADIEKEFAEAMARITEIDGDAQEPAADLAEAEPTAEEVESLEAEVSEQEYGVPEQILEDQKIDDIEEGPMAADPLDEHADELAEADAEVADEMPDSATVELDPEELTAEAVRESEVAPVEAVEADADELEAAEPEELASSETDDAIPEEVSDEDAIPPEEAVSDVVEPMEETDGAAELEMPAVTDAEEITVAAEGTAEAEELDAVESETDGSNEASDELIPITEEDLEPERVDEAPPEPIDDTSEAVPTPYESTKASPRDIEEVRAEQEMEQKIGEISAQLDSMLTNLLDVEIKEPGGTDKVPADESCFPKKMWKIPSIRFTRADVVWAAATVAAMITCGMSIGLWTSLIIR